MAGNKKTNPLVALSRINKEKHINQSAFELLDLVEKEAPSFQEGQTKDMFLFLYFINILTKGNVNFLLKGGILLNAFLGDHSRRTHDIDVLVKDPKRFLSEIKTAISNSDREITFEVDCIKISEARDTYYKNTFSFSVTAYQGKAIIDGFILEGEFTDHYEEIKKVKYAGPKIIDEDFWFYGVEKEHIVAEKILAVFSELPRPIKHLVDLYGLLKLNLDLGCLKKYLKDGLDYENRVRQRFGKPMLEENYLVKDDKIFGEGYFRQAISAGYNISFNAMKNEINDWIKTNL